MENRRYRLPLHISVEVPRLGKPSAEDFCQATNRATEAGMVPALSSKSHLPRGIFPIHVALTQTSLHTTIPMTARNDVLTPTCPD